LQVRFRHPRDILVLAASLALLPPRACWAQCEAIAEAAGYVAESHHIEICWQEAPRFAPERLITGVRLRGADGTPFETYFDEAGRELSRTDWLALGIVPKHWGEPTASAAAELPDTASYEKATITVPEEARAETTWILPPVDPEKLLEADTASEAKGARQIAVVEGLPEPIWILGEKSNIGSWQTLPDMRRFLAFQLHAPQAQGLRLHFASCALPKGARLLLGKSDTNTWVEINSAVLPWSASLPGDTLTMVCVVPDDVSLDPVDVLVDRYAYRFRDPMEALKQAGNCNLDITCHAPWQQAASGVAGIASMNNVGELFCTASLLADTNPATEIPYLLTANHCVGNASSARSLEAYWLYQTPACNAAPPNPSSVPRTTGGADLLATSGVSSGTDVTLLRLRGMPPAGITWLGWSAQPPPTGSAVVCIHHPRGDFKRISFGTLTNAGSPSQGGVPLQPYARFHESLWNSGTTEPGSSGSPLFLAGTQQIIGQLWGGRAACSARAEPDYYGRLDVSYPLLETWLGRPVLPYDLNKDGRLNASDIQLVVNAALIRIRMEAADLDLSGMTDATDIELIVTAVLHGV
jgi:hypothetical protein